MRRIASTVSTVFNPFASATLYFAGLAAVVGAAVWWCLISWSLIVLFPGLVLLRGLKLGVWTDPDFPRLRERRAYLPWAAVSSAVAMALAVLAPFPYPVRLSVVGICLWLVGSMLVTLFWKASIHVGSITGIVGLVWVLFGHVAGGALMWAPFLVAWARLYLRKHDLAQVLGGALLGTLALMAAVALTA